MITKPTTAQAVIESSQNDLKQRSKSQTNQQQIKQTNSRDQKAPDSSVKPNSYSKKSLTLQLPSLATSTAGLSALDDFDQPTFTAKTKNIARSPPAQNLSPSSTAHLKQKQRIVVPHEKLLRVMGRGNCNIKVIQEVTDAVLELEDKKIPPNQDRSFLISGETVDVTRYAFELLQALINDSDVDLLNLLPTNKQNSYEIGTGRAKPTSSSSISNAPNKWNIETWATKSTNKQVTC